MGCLTCPHEPSSPLSSLVSTPRTTPLASPEKTPSSFSGPLDKMPETQYFTRDITLSPESEPAGARFRARLAYWTFGSPANPAVLLASCFCGSLADTLPFLYSDIDVYGRNSNDYSNGDSNDSNDSSSSSSSSNSTDDAGTRRLAPPNPNNVPLMPPPLDPSRFFIIVVGLLGGGQSSSPSNTPPPWDGPNFPRLMYEDNVRLQHALCTEHLGLSRLFAYIGFSMGAQQAWHMATLFPSFAASVVCISGSARTSAHNWSFLEGPRLALETARDFAGGRYYYDTPEKQRQNQQQQQQQQPEDNTRVSGGRVAGATPEATRAAERAYATWALSHEWFGGRCWQQLGFATLAEYLEELWTTGVDANDYLAMMWTWQRGDVTVYGREGKTAAGGAQEVDGVGRPSSAGGTPPSPPSPPPPSPLTKLQKGKLFTGYSTGSQYTTTPSPVVARATSVQEEAAQLAHTLAGIQARMLVMTCRTDVYFPPRDSREEARHLRRGEFREIDSVWGHLAGGGGGTAEDNEFIKREVKMFLGV